jgi:hypothetical protein
MERQDRGLLYSAALAMAAQLAGCGGGTPVSTVQLPGALDVRVSAGAPVAGAVVTVYAISDATGQVDVSAGAGGVLGSAGPTDTDGRVTVTLSSRGYSGPVQLVTSGPAVSYADPSVAADGTGTVALVRIPSTFALSSFITRFTSSAPVVPVTLLTTLADHEALAWAHGRHSARRAPSTLSEALAARDGLFVGHFTSDPTAWNPATLRSTVPAALAAAPQGLADVAYAGLFDVAMNQLAHDTAAKAGYGASSNAISAVTLTQLLEEDLDADGRFDGRGVGGRVLVTQGTSPVTLDDQFLRKPFAQALDTWIRNTGVNRSGITQADLVSSRVYDALTTDPSDLFGGPPAPGVFDPVDRSPPALAFAVAPPQFTNQSALTLTLNASDATGVKGVFAQVGGRQFTATLNGTWSVAVDLLPGQNVITIWGEDTNQPRSNSGLGSTEPYQLTLNVLLDTSPPTAIYDGSFESYVPEAGLVLATNSDGTAKVPAATNVGLLQKRAIPANGDIVKLASRLSAGGPPDAADLEATNVANVPTLRYAVHFDPAFEAPIAAATFAAQVACAGCTYPERAGSLLVSPKIDPGFVYLDLPIATETIPDVATVPTTATIDVKLTLIDAAGNTSAGISGGTYTLHVLGPSVAVIEDVAYAAAGDPKSTFMFPVSAASYASLFDPSGQAFLPDKQVRLAKYVVTNPWPVPVAIDLPVSGGWTINETWRGEMRQMPGIAYTGDGFTFGGIVDWSASCTAVASFPCGGAAADQDTKYPIHFAGSPAQYTCDLKPGVAGSTSPWASPPIDITGALEASAALEVHAMLPGGPWDSIPAPTAGGLAVVPAATATSPGRLHVYVTRPAGVASGRTVALAFGSLNGTAPVPRFETWQWDHWWNTEPTILSCTTMVLKNVFDCVLCGSCLPCDVLLPAPSSYRHWWAYRHIRYLASAADNLTGTFALSSRGVLPDGATLFGEQTVQIPSIGVQRSIAH